MKNKSENMFHFLYIAIMGFLIYLACYATKSLLSVNTPLMIE